MADQTIPSKERLSKLPALLRQAERRVNAHVFRRGGDDSLASIPANPDRDVDLLLMEAAEAIERVSQHETTRLQEACRLLTKYTASDYTLQLPAEVQTFIEGCNLGSRIPRNIGLLGPDVDGCGTVPPVKASEPAGRKLGDLHPPNCPCWDCTREQLKF